MKKFEYFETVIIAKWVKDPDKIDTWQEEGLPITQLNKYGQDGWELCFFKEHAISGNRSIIHVIFKRQII